MRDLKLGIAMAMLFLLCTLPIMANTVGFTYQSAVNDTAWGLNGDYEADITDILKFGAEGQLQSGDAYAGNIDVAFTFFDNFRLESNNVLKGYTLDSIGRTNDIGLSFVLPVKDTEWAVGVFGKAGNPFTPIYELEDATDPNSAVLKDAGITIKEDSTLNVAVRGEFDVSRFEIGLRGIFEVAGEGDRVHQVVADIQTGGNLARGIGWTVQGKIVSQLYGEVIEAERSIIAGVNYGF